MKGRGSPGRSPDDIRWLYGGDAPVVEQRRSRTDSAYRDKPPPERKGGRHGNHRTSDYPETVYTRLADLFLTQPWVHTDRGDRRPAPTTPVEQGRKLLAKIIRERVERDPVFARKPDPWVLEVVEFAMKHFFGRVPNDERGSSRIVYRFVHEDWWPHLIEESVNHYRLTRYTEADAERGRIQSEAFYAHWPKATPRPRPELKPPGPITVRAVRVEEETPEDDGLEEL